MSHGLQVHWLRVILDEGHMLGASLAITNKLQMACALRADRSFSSSLLYLGCRQHCMSVQGAICSSRMMSAFASPFKLILHAPSHQ